MKEDIFVAVALVAALALAGLGAYRKGEHDAAARDAIALAAANDVARQRFEAAQADAARRESALQSRVITLTEQNDAERASHEKAVADLRAAARAGAVRLSIPVAACANVASAAPDNPAVAGSPVEERRDVLPGIADTVFRLAGRIASDVRDFNELRDRYDAVVAACR
jgi:hypothetical protein